MITSGNQVGTDKNYFLIVHKKVFHEVAGVKIVDRNQYNKAPKHVHKISIK